uniref:Uncharacterized protein n=1 Tax=viral metagenome TaxID=1070528 RepID=A0A6C0IEE2_9ZZZZ
MNKTKKLKSYRVTKKTRKSNRKYLGGTTNKSKNKKENNDNSDNSESDSDNGVLDIVSDKVGDFAADTGEFVANKTLRLFGLETIKNAKKEADENADNNSNVDDKNRDNNSITAGITGITSKLGITGITGKLGNIASDLLGSTTSVVQGIGSDIKDVANQTAADTIGNVNEVLGSPQLNKSVSETLENTSEIAENVLEDFNDALNSPEMKEQTAEALDNIGDYTEIAVKALEKPLDKAIDELNEAGTKATSGAISGAIKVGTDAFAAVPYLGAVVELGKIVNDGSKAIGTVIEAGNESIETAANLYTETEKGINKGIKELENKKREADDIMDRTEKSIQKFTKPINNISSIPGKSKVPTGGSNPKKTKKKLLGRKGKSKRVRFAL